MIRGVPGSFPRQRFSPLPKRIFLGDGGIPLVSKGKIPLAATGNPVDFPYVALVRRIIGGDRTRWRAGIPTIRGFRRESRTAAVFAEGT